MSTLSQAPQMDRDRLARIAYTEAADRVLAACDAGTMSRMDGRVKLASLRRAYETRKDTIRLASFISFHGLDRVLGNLKREHEAGYVGSTPVVAGVDAALAEVAA